MGDEACESQPSIMRHVEVSPVCVMSHVEVNPVWVMRHVEVNPE